MSKADEIPLTKLPKAELADKWGALKARLKKIDAEIDLLKEEFERRSVLVTTARRAARTGDAIAAARKAFR
jgi:hypothetical protein